MPEQKIKLCPFRKYIRHTNTTQYYKTELCDYVEEFQPCIKEQCGVYDEDCEECGLIL